MQHGSGPDQRTQGSPWLLLLAFGEGSASGQNLFPISRAFTSPKLYDRTSWWTHASRDRTLLLSHTSLPSPLASALLLLSLPLICLLSVAMGIARIEDSSLYHPNVG